MNGLIRILVVLGAMGIGGVSFAQTYVVWTEGPGRLGLGYPVPVPVDTPLPFDGFRTYAGLHARHQQLLADSVVVQGEITGQTRLERDIWAYRLSTESGLTPEGLPKSAVMYAGTVHAREWQSPEVVTGLMELMSEGHDDDHWLRYLVDHVSIVVVPVVNIDGFLQTQRYPTANWLDSDPRHSAFWPRDGRMRRKNHRDADENLFTVGDHLHGVDVNRNNPPFWPGPPETADPLDLVYRGPAPQSEPETLALVDAAELAPGNRLRFYADMHSYTRVFFSVRTNNFRRNAIQSRLFAMISNHHAALPGNKIYSDVPGNINQGIGTTSEYFAHMFDVPSATWEIEPGNNAGAEYGGFGTNTNDGFILPEREIRRVREHSALSMAAAAYHMAGPPHVASAKLFDQDSGALVWSAHWSRPEAGQRTLIERQAGTLAPGRDYRLWLGFSKPMRWREAGEIVPFPGQAAVPTDIALALEVAGEQLDVTLSGPTWLDQSGPAPDGYRRYRDDAWSVTVRIDDHADNHQLIENGGEIVLAIDAADLTGHQLDTAPASVVDWVGGAWSGYGSHLAGVLDRGGIDRSLAVPMSSEPELPDPVGKAYSAAWFDPARSGEGWIIEMLGPESALGYWFTYDEVGNQRWLTGLGTVQANRIRFSELVVTSGGRFGPEFDPDEVVHEEVGSAELVFADCETGWFESDVFGQELAYKLVRLTRAAGLDCDENAGEIPEFVGQGGSWFDLAHEGEGFTLHWLDTGQALIMWFTYDPDGNQYWMLGMGEPDGDAIQVSELVATQGARFGEHFDIDDVEYIDWGEMRMMLQCSSGSAVYHSVLDEFGSGEFQLIPLTRIDGLPACD